MKGLLMAATKKTTTQKEADKQTAEADRADVNADEQRQQAEDAQALADKEQSEAAELKKAEDAQALADKEQSEAAELKKTQAKGIFVAEGKSITTKAGHKLAGAKIDEKWFGKEQLAAHIKSGVLVKRG